MSKLPPILVSILVPVYKVESYIERCAISLFEQTYSNIEFVFVNDCTPDNSIGKLNAVIEKYPLRKPMVKIIEHSENKGLAVARKTALDASVGSYILNVDSDDYVDTTMVETMVNVAISEQADMVISDFYYVYKDKKVKVDNEFELDKYTYLSNLLTRRTSVCIWGRLILRSLYYNNNIFPIPGLNYGEDYVVTPRLVYFVKKIIKVCRPLYFYIQSNNESYTHLLNQKSIDNAIQANEILQLFFSKLTIAGRLPLRESKAINLVSLLYGTPKKLLPKVIEEVQSLQLSNLDISILHKSVLILAKKRCVLILYYWLIIINKVRRVLMKCK